MIYISSLQGSLLDFTLNTHSFSMPVGRIEYLFMGPMDFMEFLNALGDYSLADYIHQYELTDKIPHIIHKRIIDRLKIYLSVGGMPSAVPDLCPIK